MATYAELREKYVNGQGKEQQTKKREAPDNAKIVAGVRQYLAEHQAENAEKWKTWQETAAARDNASETARAAEEAQKKYDEYLLTEEAQSYVRQNQAAKGAQLMQGAGISTPYAAGMQHQAAPQKDQKAEALKAERDRLKAQADIAADNVAMLESTAAINALSAEDKRHLEDYVAQRSTAQASNLFSGMVGAGPQFDTYNTNPLVQKYGIGKVRQMAETYERMKNEQTAQEVAESTTQALEGKTGIGHNIASIVANVIGGTVGTLGRGIELANRTGQYQTLQGNTAYDALNIYGSTVRQETAKKIEGEGDSKLRKALSIGYQGAMSAADSIARAAVGGGGLGTLALAATGSFSQTVSEASKQGATPQQAIILGVGNAALEAATEKVPLDNMLKAAKGGIKGAKAIAKEALRQAAIEATEEEISLFGSLLLEAAVLQEKSAYQQSIAENIANGMSYEEAKEQADKAVWAEALNTAMVSAVAGGLSGGGSAIVGNVFNGSAEAAQKPVEAATQQKETQTREQPDVAQAVVQGLTQAQETEAQANAEQAQAVANAALSVAEQFPDRTQKEPKRQQQEQLDNATAAMLAENGVVQPEAEQKNEIASLWGKRDGGWGDVTDNSVWATALAMKEVNPEYFSAYMAAADSEQLSPLIDAVINAANDVRQENISPMAAATVINEVYQANGEAGLKNLYNKAGNLYNDVLQQMRDVDAEHSNIEIKGTGADGQNKSVGAMGSQFKREVKRSAIYDNTYKNSPNADVRLIGREAERQDPNIGQYDAITEKESLHEAELRTETGRDQYSEYRYLLGKDGWTGADNDTASRLLDIYRREKKLDRFTALAKKQREMGTQAGQMVQSFAKYSRANATDAATDAILDLDNLTIDQIDTTFWNPKQEAKTKDEKKNALQKWKENVSTSLLEVADDIDNVEDGDIESIKSIVRQLANLRHTTAWAGYSNDLTKRTERGLDKMDFETLKTVAKTQISMIPNDFRKRKPAEIIKQMRMQNMLFTLTTKLKNDTGNISNGLMDAVSDSFGGRMVDALLGRITKQRTVGNDIRYAKEYTKAARDAADVAGAFVSLDVPLETEKYSTGRGRTWSPNTGNVLVRLMSAYEKHLKYALEVSDKFYEGGATHVVSRSLENLGEASGLSGEQIQELAQKTGERRTFKDPGYAVSKGGQPKKGRMLARANVGLQKGLNQIGTENIGLGDLVMPFAAVSAEVKQTGIDYTGAGMISGLKEIISIAKDAKHGKEIDPYRQRSAATNFGRGMTGAALTALFTAFSYAGIIKVHNDRESKEQTMDQAQGLSGAQWNLGAALRWLETVAKGGSIEEANQAAGEWRAYDELLTVDFLEPFNTQMHIGYLLSQGTPLPQAVLQGSFDALLEMPMMQTLSDLSDIQQAFTEVSDGDYSGVYDAAGQMLGTVAGGIVPNWVRKTAQVADPYYRDTYDTNPLEKAIKQTVASIPFLSKTLPKKYDNFGNEQRRYEEGDWMNAAIDSLVTPWDTNNYKTDPVYTEVERLNESLKGSGINVTPPQPKRKINYTDKTGVEHDGYQLTDDQYQKIAVAQGQTAKKILDQMVTSSDYKKLTDDQKAYAIKAAYEFAQEQGKKAALPDYHSKAAEWISKTKESDIQAFVTRGATQALNSAISSAVSNLGDGLPVTEATKADIEETYKAFANMSAKTKEQILDEASAETVKYLTARKAGISAETYLETEKQLLNIKRAVQKAETIANSGRLTEAQKIAMIKAEGSESQDENLDQIVAMGYTAADYAKLYRDHEDYTSGTGKKKRTVAKWMQDYGISEAAAEELYEVFS